MLSLTEPQPTSSASETLDYLTKRGRLKLLSGVLAAESLQDHAERQAQNQAAEEAFVRRTLWGGTDAQAAAKEEEMRQTVLGDHTEVHHHHFAAPKASLLKPLLISLAAATGLALPIAGAMALPAILEALRPAVAAPADPREPMLLPGRPEVAP